MDGILNMTLLEKNTYLTYIILSSNKKEQYLWLHAIFDKRAMSHSAHLRNSSETTAKSGLRTPDVVRMYTSLSKLIIQVKIK